MTAADLGDPGAWVLQWLTSARAVSDSAPRALASCRSRSRRSSGRGLIRTVALCRV